jgi:hypothetical protein
MPKAAFAVLSTGRAAARTAVGATFPPPARAPVGVLLHILGTVEIEASWGLGRAVL